MNTAPVNLRRRVAAVCGQTSHTVRRHRLQTGRGLHPSDVSRLLSRYGFACCCAKTKLQSFKLNDKRSPRRSEWSYAPKSWQWSTLPWSAMVTDFAQVSTQWPASQSPKRRCSTFNTDAAARQHVESSGPSRRRHEAL